MNLENLLYISPANCSNFLRIVKLKKVKFLVRKVKAPQEEGLGD